MYLGFDQSLLERSIKNAEKQTQKKKKIEIILYIYQKAAENTVHHESALPLFGLCNFIFAWVTCVKMSMRMSSALLLLRVHMLSS